MKNYDHYEEASSLISMLNCTPLESYGDDLQNAMDEGATGTEVFMALRWNLRKLLEDHECNDLVQEKAERLVQEIDKALQ